MAAFAWKFKEIRWALLEQKRFIFFFWGFRIVI